MLVTGHPPSAPDRVHQDQPRVHDQKRRLVPLESLPRQEPATGLREDLSLTSGTEIKYPPHSIGFLSTDPVLLIKVSVF